MLNSMTNTRQSTCLATTAILITLAALSAGCASVKPTSNLPALSQKTGVSSQLTPAAADAGIRLGTRSREWWLDLNDTQLNKLIELAMQNNHDRLGALAAVNEARSLAGLANAAGRPQGALNAQANRVQSSTVQVDPYLQGLPHPPAQTLINIGQMVSWELDLFGRVGTAAAIAERQVDAAVADANAVTALLQAEVVRQYVQLRKHQQAVIQISNELSALRERAEKMRLRVQSGVADEREALASESELAAGQAEAAQIETNLHAAESALAVLVSRSPTQSNEEWRTLLATAALPSVPNAVSLVQPTDLLANRPDVVKAEALYRASLGGVALSEREHLPHLSLNAVIGLEGQSGNLGRASALAYSGGTLLQWNWLDMGRINARTQAHRANSERAQHAMEQAALKAIEDSENSLRNWLTAQQVLVQSERIEQTTRSAADYTENRRQAGLEPAVQALQAQVAFLRAHRNTLAAQANSIEAFVQAQLALAAWQAEPKEL
jgi:outer membrane protein TolC